MATDEYERMLAAVRELEQRLSAAITTGLQAVNLTIASLADQHHRAVLEQERRNGTFASRDRVDALAEGLRDRAGEWMTHGERLTVLERRYESVSGRLDELSAKQNEDTVRVWSGNTGYLVLLVLMLGSNLLTFFLTHAVR